MKTKYIGFFVSFLLFFSAPIVRAEFLFVQQPDSLIKSEETAVIYYYAADGYRYVFPNEKTFGSWFNDFGKIITISKEALAEIPLKGNVTYRPGVRMVKIQSAPKVYAIDKGGKLRWVKTEELAKKLYGDDWNRKIDDIPDVFFVNYQEGDPIENETDYNATTVAEEVKTINKDRGIAESASAPKATSKVGDLTPHIIPVVPAQPASSATSTIPFALPISTTTTPFILPTSTTSTPAVPAIPAIPATPALPAQPTSLTTSTPFVLPTSTTSTPAVPAIPTTPAVPAQPVSSVTSTPSVTPTPSATTTPSTTGITGRLVVLTPNGGEQLITGSTYNIQWTNPLVGGFAGDKNMSLSINVYGPGGGVWSITDAVLPTTLTSYQWTIPSSMPDASNYYARVCLVMYCVYSDTICPEPTAILPNHISMPSGACAGDESDATFSISTPVATSTPIIPTPSATSTPILDIIPPTISSVGATNITETGATISWTTNEASDSSAQYGTSQSYGQTSQNASLVTSHTLNLTGLSANTTYHYQVTSKDASGNNAISVDYVFTTVASPQSCPDGVWTAINFEDDPSVGSNFTGDAAHTQWLQGKGIDIAGTPSGYLHSTRATTGYGATFMTTGVVIGYAAPNFLEQDTRLSDDESLTISFGGNKVKSVTAQLTTLSSVSATVTAEAFDGSGVSITSATKIFTGATNGTITPASITVTATDFVIAKVVLKTIAPSVGVYLEEISFAKACTTAQASPNNLKTLVLGSSSLFLAGILFMAWRLKVKRT